ncbi:MAG: hypothetical protein K8T25_03645 [Planctomycetia bacterium]|nr:hypothetical protein [Planctomycetia bacterium]
MKTLTRQLLAIAVLCLVAGRTDAAPPDTDALREKYPEYRAALAALGEEQFPAAIAGLSKLSTADDPQLAADATFHLGRAQVLEERFEEALPLFAKVSGPQAAQTTHAGEALYFLGLCQAQLLKRDEAIASFDKFLDKCKDAPERMRVDAWQQVSELKKVRSGSLSDVQQHMEFSRRRLALSDAGKNTRQRQDNIIAMLDKMIDKAEQAESESSSSQQQKQSGKEGEPKEGEKEGQQGQGQIGSRRGSQPGQSPAGQNPGGNRSASGDEVSRRTQNPTDRAHFGDIRERERMERVYGALKTRFPAQYRELIEQYYKNLQEEQP